MKKENVALYMRRTPNNTDAITPSEVKSNISVDAILEGKVDTICLLKSSLSEYAPRGYDKIKDHIKDDVVSFDVKSLREKLTEEEKLLLEYLIASK